LLGAGQGAVGRPYQNKNDIDRAGKIEMMKPKTEHESQPAKHRTQPLPGTFWPS
jgi:hypothetical protein